MKQKFYKCAHCGNIIEKIEDKGVPVVCCGEAMQELVPGTVDAAVEKHVPVYSVEDNQVKVAVGSVEHPMLEEHFIEWISLTTQSGTQRKHLKPGEKPESLKFFAISRFSCAAPSLRPSSRPARSPLS